MQRAAGFTLIELMIAVAVVAILASIGYPAYTDYVTRSKISEAVGNLSDMRAKMEQFFLDNRTYSGACVTGTVAPLPTNGKYFSYACSNLSGTTYTVTATGIGGMSDFVYTIDQANTRSTVHLPPTWTAPAGSCWALKKDGSC
jgi:type IV pilus assembly protein PilE